MKRLTLLLTLVLLAACEGLAIDVSSDTSTVDTSGVVEGPRLGIARIPPAERSGHDLVCATINGVNAACAEVERRTVTDTVRDTVVVETEVPSKPDTVRIPCDCPDDSLPPAPTVPLGVVPDDTTINVGEFVQYHAHGSDTAGLAWEVTNPAVASIDATGRLTATDIGTTGVTATARGGQEFTATLDVRAPPDTSAVLIADFSYACTNLTCSFDRTSSKRPGANGLRTLWDFGGEGTASSARETFTFSSAGDYPVTLTITHDLYPGESSTVTQVVSVTDTAVPPPPPPDTTGPPPPPPDTTTPPPSGFGNEPAGYQLLVDRPYLTVHPTYCSTCSPPEYPGTTNLHLAEGFSNTEGSNKHGAYNFTIVQDQTAPQGDGSVAQARYQPGMRSGVGPMTSTFVLPPNITEVYISFWMKLSENWVGNQASVNKMFFFGVAGGNNQFIFNARGRDTGPLTAVASLQGVMDANAPPPPGAGVHGGTHAPNLGVPSTITRGRWHRYEFRFVCNSAPGMWDGQMHMWMDGRKIFEEFTTNWTQSKNPTRACNMNIFNHNPTYGGGGRGVPANDQTLYIQTTATKIDTTYSRTRILSEALLPRSQRIRALIDVPQTAPDFRILPDENQYQWVDRVYISGR